MKPVDVIPYPFGTDWTCVICGKDYPDELLESNTSLCPDDLGHLHRVSAWLSGKPYDPAKKLEYVRMVHDGEQQADGSFEVSH